MSKITWHLEKRNIKDLKDFHKNPRKLSKKSFENLKTSLEKFGLIDKPIINTDNVLIGGHQRKNVLQKLNIQEIECYVPDHALNEKEMEELNIRLNKNIGEWDFDILANEWDTDDLVAYGFDTKDFDIQVPDLPEDIELNEKFVIEIQCTDENDQKEKYEKLKELGYECRLLTL